MTELLEPWTAARIGLMLAGTASGIVVGAIPGLTGAMLIALSLPLTFTMDELSAMVLLVSMYVGSISGGLITATLLRMPGTPASIMTTLDGYPMAQSGRPGRALGLGIGASFVGGCISWLFLWLLAAPMADLSTRLGPFDFFSLVLMALVLIASVSGESLTKGLFSGILGIAAALPGIDPGTFEPRLTMGFVELNGGFQLLPVLIGLFAVNQVFLEVSTPEALRQVTQLTHDRVWVPLREWSRSLWNLIRSSLIGTWVGMLPGIGANVGSVMAYAAARNMSREPEKFGTGCEEGVVASESANNATVGGALIPLISLGIPGSVIDAILLGALVIHGLQPGPLLFRNHPEVVHTIISTMFVANVTMLLLMLVATRWIARAVNVPRTVLVPVVLVCCVVGSFALSNRMFDVWVMVGAGLAGWLMQRARIPLAPFVIGFVLARIAEEQLVAGLMQTGGSYAPLVTRPISAIFLAVSLVMAVWPVWLRWRRKSAAVTGESISSDPS